MYKAEAKLAMVRLKMAYGVDSDSIIRDIKDIMDEKPKVGFYYKVIMPGNGLIRNLVMHIGYEEVFEYVVKDLPELLETTGPLSIPDRHVIQYALEYLSGTGYKGLPTSDINEMEVSLHDKAIS